MKLRSLSGLKRDEPEEIVLDRLPQSVLITRYARSRALAVNGLVRQIHGDSYEWYGFTLGAADHPECITDIGLPVNDRNVHQYTGIGPENIARFQGSLPRGTLINGWIHSHGGMDLKAFSGTDEVNHLTVLDYVGTFIKKPVALREVIVDDLVLISGDRPGPHDDNDPRRGSVLIETDRPVSSAKIFERILGSFCYGILVGDGGWHRQDIYYRTRAILTGASSVAGRQAPLIEVDSGREFTTRDEEALAAEVSEKINPERPEAKDGAIRETAP